MGIEGNVTASKTIKGKISGVGKINGNINKLMELRGYSAYEVAVIEGFNGTEEEWLESLRGDNFTEEDKQNIVKEVSERITPESLNAAPAEHLDDTNNPHKVTAAQVGLGNVDNTSDIDKPVSKAQSDAIAMALTVAYNHIIDVGNPHGVTSEQIGLGNVDNTSDMDKPVSKAQAEAMAMVAIAANTHIANGENPHGVTSKQIGAAPAVEDSNYKGCYYRMVNGVREWINPPMVLGVEYRTTERHNGGVVYAVRLTVGELLNKGTTSTSLPSTPAEIVEIYGTAKSDAYTETIAFPIITSAGAVGARISKEATKSIAVRTYADYSGYIATATVKYTKG